MLTASTPYRDALSRALSSPSIKIMATRLAGEDDGADAMATVALRMLERELAGRQAPRNLEAYVCQAVKAECYRIYNARRRVFFESTLESFAEDSLAIRGKVSTSQSERRWVELVQTNHTYTCTSSDAPTEVSEHITVALDSIQPVKATQVRLTYLSDDPVPVRDEARRGCPFGTAVSRTSSAKRDLLRIEHTHAAAHALGLGRVAFEPIDALAWERECATLDDAFGQQVLELVEVWTSIALRQPDPIAGLEVVEGWALRLVGATTEQSDIAEQLIAKHWAVSRERVRGAA